ncbi:MAG: hypothetical protein R3332_13200 [Pseudohongiellaceae bacterium]|nr:hypothetical protein [Pseudohongiellaceae bacterium]
MLKIILSIFLVSVSPTIAALDLFDALPDKINADERYVFYSHGLIVEGQNARPVHPEFGTYEFPLIAQEIFETGGFNLIAHHRQASTDPEAYASMLAQWVRRLIEING